MTKLDPYSLATVPIEQYANGKRLGSATGFVWKRGDKYYLITNWHVVTGKNTQTENLELPIRPEFLRVHFNIGGADFWKAPQDLRLYDIEGKPVWFIHPHFKTRRIDLAAILLMIPSVMRAFNSTQLML